jgi:hypothetical protein
MKSKIQHLKKTILITNQFPSNAMTKIKFKINPAINLIKMAIRLRNHQKRKSLLKQKLLKTSPFRKFSHIFPLFSVILQSQWE